MANEYQNYVSNQGLTPEQVTYIEGSIKRYAQDYVSFWGQFFNKENWIPGHKEFSHRKHIRPAVKSGDIEKYLLTEGVGAKASTVTIANWKESVADYGTFIPYTKESGEYNFDDTVSLAKDTFSTLSAEWPEGKRASVMCTSNFQMTAEATIVATLDKAAVILGKAKAKKISGQNYVAVMTPELVKKLKEELRAAGDSLDESTKAGISSDGHIYSYDGFDIVERSDDAMYATESEKQVDKIVFLCKTQDGELPGIERPAEVIVGDNPLGSGLIADPKDTTKYMADTNHRVGSVYLNIDHLGVGIQADLGHLVCTFAHTDSVASKVPGADPVNGATKATAPVIA